MPPTASLTLLGALTTARLGKTTEATLRRAPGHNNFAVRELQARKHIKGKKLERFFFFASPVKNPLHFTGSVYLNVCMHSPKQPLSTSTKHKSEVLKCGRYPVRWWRSPHAWAASPRAACRTQPRPRRRQPGEFLWPAGRRHIVSGLEKVKKSFSGGVEDSSRLTLSQALLSKRSAVHAWNSARVLSVLGGSTTVWAALLSKRSVVHDWNLARPEV